MKRRKIQRKLNRSSKSRKKASSPPKKNIYLHMEDFFREEKIYIHVSINRLTRSLEAWQREHAFDLFAGSFRFSFITGYPGPIYYTSKVFRGRLEGRLVFGRVTTPEGTAKNRHSESPPFYSLAFNLAGVGAKKFSRPRERTMNAVVPSTRTTRDRAARSGACERTEYWYHARRICHRGCLSSSYVSGRAYTRRDLDCKNAR